MIKNFLSLLTYSLCLLSCTTVQHVAQLSGDHVPIESHSLNEDAAILELIQPYKEALSAEMNEVIVHNQQVLEKGRMNSSMGNYFADLLENGMQKRVNDSLAFAVQNYGGLRIPNISKGPVTKSTIFELMPFDNSILILDMDSSEVQVLCNHMLELGGWPISKGLQYSIDEGKATDILIQGTPIQSQQIYKVVISDYIANGGDNCHFLKPIKRHNTSILIRDLFLEELQQLHQLGETMIVDSSIRIIQP